MATLSQYLADEAIKKATTVIEKDLSEQFPLLYKALLTNKQQATRFFQISKYKEDIPAAMVVPYNAALPQAPRGEISSFVGEMFPLGMKYSLGEKEQMDLQGVRNGILDQLYNDALNGAKAIEKRWEFALMQALSTTKSDLTADNNPAGLTYEFDYNIPTAQKVGVTTVWSNTAAKGLKEIVSLLNDMATLGIDPAYILIEQTTIANLLAQTDTHAQISSIQKGKITQQIISVTGLNAFMAANNYPEFVVVKDRLSYLKSDGTIDATRRAWDTGKITFIPRGKLGRLAYMNAPNKPTQSKSGFFQTVGTFNILRTTDFDTIALDTTVRAYGYPVIDRLYDCFFVNTESTSW